MCVCVGSNERGRESVDNVFFFAPFSCDRLPIYIHKLKYQCNPSLNCNEQYKEEIGHDSSTL